jgi:hypothetical protein
MAQQAQLKELTKLAVMSKLHAVIRRHKDHKLKQHPISP